MNYLDDIARLRGEKWRLEGMLSSLPEERVIDRLGLDERLEEVKQELERLEAVTSLVPRARITFRGKPVVGTHGILASFGVTALQRFDNMLALVGAALRQDSLQPTGPTLGRDEHRLLITGTAIGSFGFDLEAYQDGQQRLLEEERPIAQALEWASNLLESCRGSDDELAEAVSDLDNRTVNAVREFLELVAQEKAAFTFEYGRHLIHFPDSASVQHSAERLLQDNVHEEEIERKGTFEGYLPHSLTFEFTDAEFGLIKGKIMSSVQDVATLNELIHSRVSVKLRRTVVVGNGKPKFALLGRPELVGE